MGMRRCYRFIVTGRVQHVGFRQATCTTARALGLHGWVRNRADGAVEGVVRGDDPSALQQFRRFLDRGPRSARVAGVRWEREADSDSNSGIEPGRFVIRC